MKSNPADEVKASDEREIKQQQNHIKMETVYTFEGWVKEVIDNDNADILQKFHANGIGELGKQTLVEMAEWDFEYWTDCCKNLDTTKGTAVYVCVYANIVSPNGLLVRTKDGVIYKKLAKIKPYGERE